MTGVPHYGTMESTDSLPPPAPTPTPTPSTTKALKQYLDVAVDPKLCTSISVYACFLTGFSSAVSFTACYVWPGFQTGNVAQLAIAIARTFDPAATRTYGFQKSDQQALTALVSFWIGTSLGRIGDRIGAKKRSWLVLAAFLQVLMAMTCAILAHYSGEGAYGRGRDDPSWATPKGLAALGFLSASLGLQGIVGKRIGSAMNTTVVLTTTWVEIFNDPTLFALRSNSRDVRVAGVLGVLIGAFIARALLGVAGSGGTIAILCAFRVLQGIWWGLIPAPKS